MVNHRVGFSGELIQQQQQQQQQQAQQQQQQRNQQQPQQPPQPLNNGVRINTGNKRGAQEESSCNKRQFMEHLATAETDEDDSDATIAAEDLIIARIIADFMNHGDFSHIRQYRLESHGIFEIGYGIRRQPDVPALLYDNLSLEIKPPSFPIHHFNDYLETTLFNDNYGTPTLAYDIFPKTLLAGHDETKSNFITRAIFILSENVQCIQHPSRLYDLEVSYCHFALWPLINLACGTFAGMLCEFKYPYADQSLMDDVRVLFLHASGKDKHLRLWIMKPCHQGTVISFERINKATKTTNSADKSEPMQLIKFFWQVKEMLQRGTEPTTSPMKAAG
ncbi:unnamed protein product [Absidia cylindrospora]